MIRVTSLTLLLTGTWLRGPGRRPRNEERREATERRRATRRKQGGPRQRQALERDGLRAAFGNRAFEPEELR